MISYNIKEATTFAVIGTLLGVFVFPHYFLLTTGVIVATYVLLTILSIKAFRVALNGGFVKEALGNTGSRKVFFIATGCPHKWLVKRYIRTNCYPN